MEPKLFGFRTAHLIYFKITCLWEKKGKVIQGLPNNVIIVLIDLNRL